ncbi:MAG: dihydroorotate dehydrogenase electron transfer subunit [Desulfobacterales bacterium]|nr:dihydroorotate dehydrogenase electron transfer subunit [Desulfobacterales bacterium]
MIQEKVEILWNREVSPTYFSMGLTCDAQYKDAMPGQFIMIRLEGLSLPLLRRPFSICRQIFGQDGGFKGIELLYKVVGDGTAKLSRATAGDIANLLGPLGNTFTVPETVENIFFVGGGIGVAPMVFLAEALKAKQRDLSSCTLFLGGRTGDDILYAELFSDLGMKVCLTTDDGSKGEHCLVTEPVERAIQEEKPGLICTCGPHPMLKSVADIAQKYNVPCQISTETIMACGMGACLGCAVESRRQSERFLHVCKDGPVFDAEELKL